MMYELRDFGFSTCVGIGGDPIIGTTHIDCLAAFEADPETDAIVMIGEIGGDAEERAAAYIKDNVRKPVVGYVAGFTAPEGKTMGHAGAIVSGSAGTAAAKQEALEAVGVKVGKTPSDPLQSWKSMGKCGASLSAPTSISGATSPAPRAIARIMPVMMPGIARGNTMRSMVCHLVAPQANEPSRIERGTAASASSVATITTGKVNSASVMAAHINPPVP